jgi:hypothetical protein
VDPRPVLVGDRLDHQLAVRERTPERERSVSTDPSASGKYAVVKPTASYRDGRAVSPRVL